MHNVSGAHLPHSPADPPEHQGLAAPVGWRGLKGAAESLALARFAQQSAEFVVIVARDARRLHVLLSEVQFFLGEKNDTPVLKLPDWECLPYDVFSPHQDIVSERMRTLSSLPETSRGILFMTLETLMQRLPPRGYVLQHTFRIQAGQTIDLDSFRRRLTELSYLAVSQVMAPGEFAIRGGIVDVFPMGGNQPFRLDLFDERVESLRYFDPETQRSGETVSTLELLPAREFPMTDDAIRLFRSQFRKAFEGDPQRQRSYTEVSAGKTPAGIDFFFPLFFERTATLLDYVSDDAQWFFDGDLDDQSGSIWAAIGDRYANANIDTERRVLPPESLYVSPDGLLSAFDNRSCSFFGVSDPKTSETIQFAATAPVDLPVDHRLDRPFGRLLDHLATSRRRTLLVADSLGRREGLEGVLRENGYPTVSVSGWDDFVNRGDLGRAISVASIDRGLSIDDPSVELITESQLYGERTFQRRRRSDRQRDPDAIIRSLAELGIDDPVVHLDQGVGRYRGLCTLELGGQNTEFVIIEYRDGDKLYVPVLSLQLISRYLGGDPENAPLHKLGSDQWTRVREKAREKAYDVAAELLEVEALRQARDGYSFKIAKSEYNAFASRFPFEETPDQSQAILDVIDDLKSPRPMDRLVCGDVGFGKTEIALRAALIAVLNRRQVVLLVPTTLLAQQHYDTFVNRFADSAVHVELLSRFRTRKEIDKVLASLPSGMPDILIGTHRLLQDDIVFKDLGLVIIDEEHRFGVRQKEKLKKLRSRVDVLTLTATPIPRTLNMSMAGLRSISLIGTPPKSRLSIKTFVRSWSDGLVRESCIREIHRGGQIYFVHNEVRSIERMTRKVQEIVPEATVRFGHGQMPERELERLMRDFYHQRFDILVCTTIIESGIDIMNANTIIINRADRFGLAQLHQLRGRVGRSHHQAYAYLLTPDENLMTADARKRLDAIASLNDLGAGFALASHDLEIRGAGELLGEDQSGTIDQVGFTLYADYLNKAVRELSAERQRALPEAEGTLEEPQTEIILHTPALFGEDYLPDVHTRLVLYKRISGARDMEQLYELQIETVDRFGLLPPAAKMLFQVTGLKLLSTPLGVKKIDVGADGGWLEFGPSPNVRPERIIELIQSEPGAYRMTESHRLQIRTGILEPENRVTFVENLLKRLQHE